MINRLPVGGITQLRARFVDQHNHPIQVSDPITYLSSSPSIATVDENGRVTAVSTGSCTITASSGEFSDTNPLSVYTPVLSGILI